ncbi:hypothetical protein AGLY_006912, partial [Aphis glycines]
PESLESLSTDSVEDIDDTKVLDLILCWNSTSVESFSVVEAGGIFIIGGKKTPELESSPLLLSLIFFIALNVLVSVWLLRCSCNDNLSSEEPGDEGFIPTPRFTSISFTMLSFVLDLILCWNSTSVESFSVVEAGGEVSILVPLDVTIGIFINGGKKTPEVESSPLLLSLIFFIALNVLVSVWLLRCSCNDILSSEEPGDEGFIPTPSVEDIDDTKVLDLILCWNSTSVESFSVVEAGGIFINGGKKTLELESSPLLLSLIFVIALNVLVSVWILRCSSNDNLSSEEPGDVGFIPPPDFTSISFTKLSFVSFLISVVEP